MQPALLRVMQDNERELIQNVIERGVPNLNAMDTYIQACGDLNLKVTCLTFQMSLCRGIES